jgi:hypothetical protein
MSPPKSGWWGISERMATGARSARAGDEQKGQRGHILGRLRDDDPKAVLPGDPLPHLRDQPSFMDDEPLLRARLGAVFPPVSRIISRDISPEIASRQGGTHQDDGQGAQDVGGCDVGHRCPSALGHASVPSSPYPPRWTWQWLPPIPGME